MCYILKISLVLICPVINYLSEIDLKDNLFDKNQKWIKKIHLMNLVEFLNA